jgi:hypothetical protein
VIAKKRKEKKLELKLYRRIVTLFEKDPERWMKQIGQGPLYEAMCHIIRIEHELKSFQI